MARDGMVRMKVEGLRNVDRALAALGKNQARGIMRRALVAAAKPIADEAASLAPEFRGDLQESIRYGSRLSRRQAAQQRRADRAAGRRDFVKLYVGAGPLPQAHLREFGTADIPPSPYMRPAWDKHGGARALSTILRELRAGYVRELAREARKAGGGRRRR